MICNDLNIKTNISHLLKTIKFNNLMTYVKEYRL